MTTKLSRNEVRLKYKPIPDPNWTPEIEAEFFARLPRETQKAPDRLSPEKEFIVRGFAREILGAKRMGDGYLQTLSTVLGRLAFADTNKCECRISRRSGELGPANIVRAIQTQMLSAGILVKETRPQGNGFVGDVFVYCPRGMFRYRIPTLEYLELLYRNHEGEAPARAVPANILPEDVPY